LSELWNRQVLLTIDGRQFTIDEYDIEFKTEASKDISKNQATIGLWNLSQKTIDSIKKEADVELKAGYGLNIGTIFKGVILGYAPEKNEADMRMDYACSDLTLKLYDSEKTSIEVEEGVQLTDIVREIFEMAEVPVGKIDDFDYAVPESGRLPARGETGTCKQMLEDLKLVANGHIQRTENGWGSKDLFVVYVDGGLGYFTRGKSHDTEVQIINSSTGLLSAEPKQEDEQTTADQSGVPSEGRIETLLNWRIRLGTYLKVESNQLNGYFIVQSYEHLSDGNNFKTTMEVARP